MKERASGDGEEDQDEQRISRAPFDLLLQLLAPLQVNGELLEGLGHAPGFLRRPHQGVKQRAQGVGFPRISRPPKLLSRRDR